MRRLKIAGLVMAVGFLTAAAFAYSNVQVVGPFFTTSQAFDSLRARQEGGTLRTFLAQDSLKVGDLVYDTLNNIVRKSATLVSYNKKRGVVVGGARTSGRAAVDSSDVGTLAATANQRVLVALCGRVWIKGADSAYVGDQLIPSTAVAGTVKRRTTAIDTFNRIVGRNLLTRDSGKALLVDTCLR